MPTIKKHPRSKFYELLQQQVRNEFNASQQYVALAVWFDNDDLPQLAKYFYAQAIEERNHAMALVQYMMDTDHHVDIPGTGDVRNDFADARELIELALEQEKEVAADIKALAKAARDEDDYTSEQFIQWFLKEQVEEISKMTTLLNIYDRAKGDLFEVEKFLDREGTGDGDDSGMPPVAGGKL
ncbi:bacterioferritin [Prauserella sp. PE36]|uniref:Ferritin n=1 Tax=Prauserella endophytica TaxID=1592324 RepID=A0ABY2SC99_9PSEU|nr:MULTISPECIES: ferritin [Prauserella]PXY34895.1 bacterioferritin [Prauserella coralliicola]RBM19327.1 bacterioferritin [Prauserella sp. PE36]TKG73422.1 ferritin [Prauserella endophytica]